MPEEMPERRPPKDLDVTAVRRRHPSPGRGAGVAVQQDGGHYGDV